MTDAGKSIDTAALPSFAFGDSPALADELLALVIAGKKTATCTALPEFEKHGEPVPRPGDRYRVLDGKGRAACVVETTQCDVTTFNEVTAEMAALEGEGDLSLEYWRREHRKYFKRQEIDWTEQTPLLFEQFRLIEVLEPQDQDQ